MAVCDATSPASAPPTPSATAKIYRLLSARNASSFNGRRSFRPRSLKAEETMFCSFSGLLIEASGGLYQLQYSLYRLQGYRWSIPLWRFADEYSVARIAMRK